MTTTLLEFIGPLCIASPCTAKREREYIMCSPHWQLLTPAIQRQVIKAVGGYTATPDRLSKWKLRDALNAAKVCASVEQRRRDDAQRSAARAEKARR